MTWSSRRLVTAAVIVLMTVTWPIVAVADQLTLTWIDSSAGELGFAVERSTGAGGAFAEVTRTGPGVTTYTDPNVTAATTYCYRVRAFNAAGFSAYSNVACATPATGVALAVVKIGSGGGTVTSAPTGISCGANCSAGFASVSAVTLTATAATDSTFTGWSGGGCSGTGTCTVTMTGVITVTASFALKPAGAASAGALSVSPPSLTFSKIVGQPNPPGQTVTVTAPPGQVWTTRDTMPFANVIGLPFSGSSGVTGTGSAAFQVVPSSGMTFLGPDVYDGSITLSAAGFADLVIPVRIIVTDSSAPPLSLSSLSVTPQSVTFSTVAGQPNPPAQTVTVAAATGQVWTTHDSMSFANLTGQPYNGSGGVTGTGSATFQIVPSNGMMSLAPGVYNGSITVSTVGATDLVIPVPVIVTPSSPAPNSLSVSPQSLTFSRVAGQPNPPAQTVTVTAAAGQVWTTHDSMSFANISGQPYNGSDGVTGTGPGTFQVVPSSGMTALAPGVYNAFITVSTAGAPDLVIPVPIIVTAP